MDGAVYTFITAHAVYSLALEVRDDPVDRYCVLATAKGHYNEWTSDGDLRGAIGVAVMRIIRHETGDNCMCQSCKATPTRHSGAMRESGEAE